MAFFGVTIEEIEKVWNHPNADKLSLAKLKNLSFQFVISKNQFKIGEKVLYFPIDSLLTIEILQKLNMVGKLSGKEKNRIKTITLRGEISQGLVTNIDKFLTKDQERLSPDEITKILGVTKYEPPILISQDGILNPLPQGYSTYDIEGADRNQEIISLMLDMNVVIMEKIEGTNFSCVKKDNDIFINQRNFSIVEKQGIINSYWEVARKNNLINYLLNSNEKEIGLYAEFCGPKIQNNIYNLKNHELFLFDIRKDLKWLSFDDFIKYSNQLNIKTAPIIFEGKLRNFLKDKTVQEASNGQSIINSSILREGIVIKPREEIIIQKLGRLIIKQRSPLYLAKTDF